jgi:tmRNA-binding protein
MYEELLELAKNLDISIRKEKGNFRSGYCVVNDREVLLINKSTPVETLNTIIAQGLARHSQNIHIKPAVREFIEREIKNYADKNSFNLEIEY